MVKTPTYVVSDDAIYYKHENRDTTVTSDEDTTPIRELVIEYGIEHEEANKLIGKTEAETLANITHYRETHTPKETTRYQDMNDVAASEPIKRPRYGYDYIDGTIVMNQAEQKVIKQMLMWIAEGKTYMDVASLLNAQHVPTKRLKYGANAKTLWYGLTVKRIVDRYAHKEGRQNDQVRR